MEKSIKARLSDLEEKMHAFLKATVYYSDGTTAIKEWISIYLEFIEQKVKESYDESINKIVKVEWLSDTRRQEMNSPAGQHMLEIAKDINEKGDSDVVGVLSK